MLSSRIYFAARAGGRLFSSMAFTEFDGLNSPCLGRDSQYPKFSSEKLRMYNMRFCPYAERGLIALALKRIPPDWFLKMNPIGKVPVLESPDGKLIIYESLVCAEYIQDTNPNRGKDILPMDPLKRAHQRMRLQRLHPLHRGLLRYIFGGVPLEKFVDSLHFCESLLESDYFAGDEPGWPDYMMWPWFERLGPLSIVSTEFKFTQAIFPKIFAYMSRMSQLPEISAFIQPLENHLQYMRSRQAGGMPDFDAGIPEARRAKL